MSRRPLTNFLPALLLALLGAAMEPQAAEHGLATAGQTAVASAPDSEEALAAIKGFRIPGGWKVELIASEPLLANPVAFAFDEQERIYVVETFRHSEGVLDIRGRSGWPSDGHLKSRGLANRDRRALGEEVLDADVGSKTVADRERILRMYFAEKAPELEKASDRVRLIYRGPDGRGTRSTVFADGFSDLVDGLASGVLARDGQVWFANIPHLWRLSDTDGDGVADERESLLEGFGVRVGFLGHDLHGLVWGPDGRLYFSIGDRGAHVVTRDGRVVDVSETGAVFRCEPDGSHFEVFAYGFRNPQELVFDALGNLWTGDNNSDGGDQARWTHVVEQGDSGWRIGWQFLESPHRRGPWNAEKMWAPEEAARIGYIVPPLANIGAGPSGVTYGYGTGLPEAFNGRFFMVDFRGGPSGIWSIGVKPNGAGYAVADAEQIIWDALPTDVELGPDGGLYWSDWIEGWNKTGKGRIYRAFHPESAQAPVVAETRRLLAAKLADRDEISLFALLRHPDMRVRLKAQFALADRNAHGALERAAREGATQYARLHGLWGLGQIARKTSSARDRILPFLRDADSEVRGQAAKLAGDLKLHEAGPMLDALLKDPEPRPRFFAAIALGRLGRAESADALVQMLRSNDDKDPFLRHAGVTGLTGALSPEALAALRADPSPAVRLAAVVALRRRESARVADFLHDSDPRVVLEAARAANDLPIVEALPALASLIDREGMSPHLTRRVLNAHLRLGGRTNAEALIRFASRPGAPEDARLEALQHVGRFRGGLGRDVVTGLWRPLPVRDTEGGRRALAAGLSELLRAPESLQVAAIEAAADLDLKSVAPQLRTLARNGQAPAAARAAALRALAQWQDEGLETLLAGLRQDPSEKVREEILRLQGRAGGAGGLESIREALENGSARERQAAIASLASLPGERADRLLARWIRRAQDGNVPREIELDLMEAARARGEGEARAALAAFEASLQSGDPTRANRPLLAGGDPSLGRAVFLEKQEVQCARCHKVGGDANVVGPDLKDVGSRMTAEQILESILHPNATVAAGYENVMIETADGEEFSGTVQRETDEELVLNTVESGQVTVKKKNITFRKKGLSSMPEGLGALMTPRELRDLIAYLAALRGGA